ncbi:MAG: trypsin-like peptidase domain-containing protein [Patescibacteria group bacterium]
MKLAKQSPILVGAISGGITALIISALILQFFPKFPQENAKTAVIEDDEPIYSGASSQETMVIDAVNEAQDSVVSIVVTKDVPKLELDGGNPFGLLFPRYKENGTERREVGGGSGFLVSADGYIVTNKHVVSDPAAEYTTFTTDGQKHETKIVALDPLNDVAILKIEGEKLPYLEFADSDELQVGQSAIAIGTPLLEFRNSVSVGVISGLSRSITASAGFGQSEQLDGVIQTDAAINPGNSGGPLLNLEGKVIGVNVAVASAENIGFSLPSNLVKAAFESVRDNGKIVRPYLGVRYALIDEKLKEANNLEVDYGVLVLRGTGAEELAVIPGSPADKAGLLENDIILEIDGQKLDEDHSLGRIIATKKVGDTVKLKVLSKGEEKTVEVKLEEIK